MNSFSLIQTGMAERKLRKPRGANAWYVSSNRSNLRYGFVVERNCAEVSGLESGLFQNIGGSVVRKGRVMLFARETFLVCRGNNLAVQQQSRCTVMIKR